MRPPTALPVRNDDLTKKALRLAADLVDAAARDDMVTLRALMREEEPEVVELGSALDPILARACAHYGARPEGVRAGRRTKAESLARTVTAFVGRRLGMTYPEIARDLGCHHTSVMHACTRVTEEPDLLAVAMTVLESVGARGYLDAVPA